MLQLPKQHLHCALCEHHPKFHVKSDLWSCALRCILWCLHELHQLCAIGNLIELLICLFIWDILMASCWIHREYIRILHHLFSLKLEGEKNMLRGLWSTKGLDLRYTYSSLEAFHCEKGHSIFKQREPALSTLLKGYCLSLGLLWCLRSRWARILTQTPGTLCISCW